MKPIIQINNLSYSIADKHLLQNISFNIEKGETIAVLGKNGAGKSTLIDNITGDLRPSEGEVLYPYHGSLQKFKAKLGIVYDSIPFYPMLKVKEILNLFCKVYGVDYTQQEKMLELLEIDKIKNSLFSKLSKGERKKIGLFVAFCHQPDVVILDEPTGELDPLIRDILWTQVFKNNKEQGLLFSTHHWEEAYKYADRVAFINEGQIVGEVLTKQQIQDKVQGKKVTLSKGVLDTEMFTGTSFVEDDSTITFFPAQREERNLIQQISKYTLNFSIEEKSLEDYYKAII